MRRLLPRIFRPGPVRPSAPADPHDHPVLRDLEPAALADLPHPIKAP
jgi:hypothetical protein